MTNRKNLFTVLIVFFVIVFGIVAIIFLSGTLEDVEKFSEEKGVEREMGVEGEKVVGISACNFVPEGDYMLCCQDEEGEFIDCTGQTDFQGGERLLITVNPNLLNNISPPYKICDNSDLMLFEGETALNYEGHGNNDELPKLPSCVLIEEGLTNFVVRKEGFVPPGINRETLTLFELSVIEESRERQILLHVIGERTQEI
jgi:hypothetical protein